MDAVERVHISTLAIIYVVEPSVRLQVYRGRKDVRSRYKPKKLLIMKFGHLRMVTKVSGADESF